MICTECNGHGMVWDDHDEPETCPVCRGTGTENATPRKKQPDDDDE